MTDNTPRTRGDGYDADRENGLPFRERRAVDNLFDVNTGGHAQGARRPYVTSHKTCDGVTPVYNNISPPCIFEWSWVFRIRSVYYWIRRFSFEFSRRPHRFLKTANTYTHVVKTEYYAQKQITKNRYEYAAVRSNESKNNSYVNFLLTAY